jgi:tetratricopeptide (TPR) repeat protein
MMSGQHREYNQLGRDEIMKTCGKILSIALTLLLACCILQQPAHAQAVDRVKVEHTTLSLPTYPWLDDRNPVFTEYEGRIYYPYTRQDHILKAKEDRQYRAIVLENEYLKVTCLPDLGGRIHSVLDKTTGDEMFHKNDEIKPALIAMRGAWISGGIEWNAGPHGHTVTIVSPVSVTVVENEDGSATLVVGNTEKMFRTRWTVRLTLHPGKAYLDEAITMYNPTDGVHPYYFWNCTAFPNLEGTRFIYPMTLGTDHNGTKFYKWPMHEGKDLSLLRDYDTMSSVFGYDCEFDFFGSYDYIRDRGLVSYANHMELKGKKAWTWGKDEFGVVSQMALSDAGPIHAQYIEVQSGPLLTQSDYGMLKPHQAVAWREFWYPVHGLGDGFEYATRDVAVQARRDGRKLRIAAISTGDFPAAVCKLTQGEKVLLEQSADLSPKSPVILELERAPEGPIGVTLSDADGAVLLSYKTPLNIPMVEAPDLTEKPARPDGQPTPDELYNKAFLADSQSNPAKAREGYLAVLEADPMHVPALCGLATLDIEVGRFAEAEVHAQKAVERDPGSGRAWYLLGVAQLNLGNAEEARKSGYKAARTLDALALGYSLVGRACMRLGELDEAERAFARATAEQPLDARNRDRWLAARYALGQREKVAEALSPVVTHEDPTDLLARALLALAKDDPGMFAEDLKSLGGETEFITLETATFFAELTLVGAAVDILEVSVNESSSPLLHYYLAYYSSEIGKNAVSEAQLDAAVKKPYARTFPSRVEAVPVLEYAVEKRPRDAVARLMLGHVRAGLGRLDSAVQAWRDAVELNPRLSEAWRAVALHAKVKANDLDEAERCYRKAVEAASHDQLLYAELASLLEQRGKRAEGLQLVERMPKTDHPRYDVVLWLADAYVAEARYDDCLELLMTASFSNWEGASRPHDIFVKALLARGKDRFAATQHGMALEDFQKALTYPENLEVGAHYALTDAEVRYWLGKTLLALGRESEARAAWETGAAQVTSSDPPLPAISVTAAQDEYVKRCATALEVLNAR